MRKLLLLTAVAALAAPVLAQPAGQGKAKITAPAAAPPLEITPERRAALEQAVARGRLLAAIDRAGQVTTRDMLNRLTDPDAAGVLGWVAEPAGNGVTVTYYGREGDNFVAVYRAQMLGGRVSSPEVFAEGSRPQLQGIVARMAAARAAAGTLERTPCAGDTFNTVVLPPSGTDDPVQVYRLSPRMSAERVPAGGHYRTEIAPDGSVGETVALATECVEVVLPPVAAGAQPRPLVVNARDSELPSELHVFLSGQAGRPLVVATGTEAVRLWGVTPTGISELRQ